MMRLTLGVLGVLGVVLCVVLGLTLVFGISGASVLVPLVLMVALLGEVLASLAFYHDIDGQIASGRVIEKSGILSGCDVVVIRLPEDTQAAPFQQAPTDTHWVPTGTKPTDWKQGGGDPFPIQASDDKLGDFCDLSADTIAALGTAIDHPDTWTLSHEDGLRRGYLYSAPTRVAAYVFVDR